MLVVGTEAPSFTLPDEEGNLHSLSDFKGKWVVLYFYPKDNTPGCTTEACSVRDVYDALLAQGAVVIGISKDSPQSHKKFKQKYNLPFYLLSDESTQTMQTYGAWGEKTMYGKKVMGTIRCTYIIGPDGIIRKVFPKVQPEGHGEEVLNFLKNSK
ncbi:MAG TPA: thioredoxin-dependent thiol peroxidase [Termitinemataceae bacterium]|uniref:thioredoxin-dependent thiol peroxidase n=1 Tax=Treponema sp. J25 TaxID=2094121 RepID=UPI00104E7CC1|nr:thioredoxin-dependent thiol peroxidase [Treponema sp. J25]TCW61489.1 thioredoxin-dependent thiol peroxidase [Treponema sp. J25]HOJ99881.1 thioredoxin-dependent thiol peroxidase [Termitinemataceae bacterium]HOM24116.1 thioredoxin-dependent thiol peroxidase [Termitinemataceae bacterium]HPQ01117.1 thioredoxin-dependent thiol peroxidase [Termitinemataceae bacterium]